MGTQSEKYSPLNACVEDMRDIAATGAFTLDAQVRAYDMLSELLDEGMAVPQEKSDIALI